MTSDSNPGASVWLRLILTVIVLTLFMLGAWKLGLFESSGSTRVFAAAESVGGPRWLGPIYIAVYAALSTLAIPVMPLAYGGGAVFGFWRGALYIWIASMLGITAGYYLARGVLAGTARKMLGPHHDLLKTAGTGSVIVTTFRTRLLPFLPGGLLTYAAAIGDVPAASFLLGSALGIVPGTLLAAFVGDRFMISLRTGDRKPLWLALGIAVVVLGLSFVPTIVKKMRK